MNRPLPSCRDGTASRSFGRASPLTPPTPRLKRLTGFDAIGLAGFALAAFISTGAAAKLTHFQVGALQPVLAASILLAVPLVRGVSLPRFIRAMTVFLPVLAICLVTVIWSESKPDTLTKLLSVSTIIVAAALFVSAGSTPITRMMTYLALYGLFHSGLSLVLIVLHSDLALQTSAATGVINGVSGIAGHKTVLTNIAVYCLAGAVWALTYARQTPLMSLLFVLSATLTICVLAIGQGGQATYAAAVLIAFVLAAKLGLKRTIVAAVLAVAAVAVLLPFNGGLIALVSDLTGKSVTLSGRTILWDYAFQSIREHPVLGVGFFSMDKNAGFLTWQLSRSVFDSGLGIQVPHLHNQWIEIAYMTGGVGMVVIALSVIGTTLRLANRKARTHEENGALMLLLVGIAISTFESNMLRNTIEFYIIACALMFAGAVALRGGKTVPDDSRQNGIEEREGARENH